MVLAPLSFANFIALNIFCDHTPASPLPDREGALGTTPLGFICLNKAYFDHVDMPSVLSHETAHSLGGIHFDEPLASLLGWEIDARMIHAGYRCHRTSLYRFLRDILIHVSYLKADSVGRVERWKEFILKLLRDEFTPHAIDKEIAHFEEAKDGVLGRSLADYTLLPYLSLKGTLRNNTASLLREYDADVRTELEIPTLIQAWNELMS